MNEQHLRQAIREVERELADGLVSQSTSSVIVALNLRGYDLNVKRDWERIADLRAEMRYSAKEIDGSWFVCQGGRPFATFVMGHMPETQEQCEDAARRMNDGATIMDLPPYQQASMGRIVARAPWGDDTYTAEDAENGCIPSDAVYAEEDRS